MWATLRPITNNTKLVTKVVSKVVDYEVPCFHNHGEYKIFMTQIQKVIQSITDDLLHIRKLDSLAKMVAYAWFEYAISCIIEYVTRRPRFVKSHGKHLIVSGADIIWSINKLSSITWLEALGYTFHEVVDEQSKSWISRIDMEAFLYPYVRGIGESSVKKFSKNCSRWNSNRQNEISESCSFSCEGVLVLFNWIRRVLRLTMNNANTRCIAGREISCRNMIWAFNWTRLKHFEGKPNSVSNKQRKGENKKDQATADAPLKCLPPDILISHILPKLQWDSLSRFKCVSRYWKETISSAYFQRLLGEQDDHQTHSFCIFYEFHRVLTEVKHECDGLELLILKTTYPTKECHSSFYASCSGFLCLRLSIHGRSPVELVVGNPLTGEWSLIPPFPLYVFKLWRGPGLAVDITSDPSWYKLVILLSCCRKGYFFYVFSSKTGEWEASNAVVPKFGIDEADAHIWKGDSVYINGLLYWVCVGCKLVWFDLEKDEVDHADLPACSHGRRLSYSLGSLESPVGGQRQLTCTIYFDDKRLETYKLAGKDQWIRLLSIPVRCLSYVQPFPYMGGEHQFVWENGKIVACSIGTRKRRVVALEDGPFCPIAFQLNVAPLPKVLNNL